MLIIIAGVAGEGEGEGCDQSLGLASNKIPAEQISSSLPGSSPNQGRLNNPGGAWCFQWSKLKESRSHHIYWQVDLGSPHLLSGFDSQGPPESLYGVTYISYISLSLQTSLDGESWTDCCGEEETMFYLDDKKDEVDKVERNSFSDLVAARYVRVRVSTSLRWVGDDNKCFRFEMLGCSSLSQAESGLTAVARSHGYILSSWQCPNLTLPSQLQLSLDVRHFGLRMTRQDTGEVRSYNTTDHSVIHPSPVYGQRYSVELTCFYHGLALNCGQLELEARPEVSLSCRAHSSFCEEHERLVFKLPESVRGTYLGQGKVLVEWTNSPTGWVSDLVTLTLKENSSSAVLLEREMVAGKTKMLLNGLDLGPATSYRLNFIPSGGRVPRDGGDHYRHCTVWINTRQLLINQQESPPLSPSSLTWANSTVS